MILG
ncbi:hypothetical protein CP8484711_0479A, partial [Chlamydia psittaci 84-8471/1]|jgi:hypothetical protein